MQAARHLFSTAIFLFLIILSSSCAIRPDVSEIERQVARTFSAPKGKAVLFVYRPSNVRAMAAPRAVIINGEHIVSNTNGTFVAMPLSPGTYRVQAALHAPGVREFEGKYPEIVLNTKAGEVYFIRQSLTGSVLGSSEGRRGTMVTLQSGGAGAPVPLLLGNEPPPFDAQLVGESQGKTECAKLKLVGSYPVP